MDEGNLNRLLIYPANIIVRNHRIRLTDLGGLGRYTPSVAGLGGRLGGRSGNDIDAGNPSGGFTGRRPGHRRSSRSLVGLT
jgi:hypothetical protein